MSKKDQTRLVSYLAVIIAMVLMFQNCSPPEVLSGSGTVDVNSTSATGFQMYPQETTLLAGSSQVVTILGGKTPYTWSITPANCGTFNTTTKTYTAPATSSICTLSIRDSANQTVRSIISVAESDLLVSYSPNPAPVSTNIVLTGTGGTPGYTFTLLSGSGSLSGSTYLSPASAETAQVRMTDSKGRSVVVAILVGGGASGGGTGATFDVFRMLSSFTSDVIMTKTQGEGAGSGYVEQPAGKIKIFGTGGTGRMELFRCLVNGRHFVSNFCNIGVNEGSLGFLDSAQSASGTRAISVCLAGFTGILTYNPAECTGGMITSGFGP